MRLKDKMAFITGSGSGIGQAIALRFAQEGASIAVNDVVADRAQETIEQLNKVGGEHIVAAADVTDLDQLEKAAAAVAEKFGRIDILVNNAGVLRDNYLTKMPVADWDFVLNINLKGPFLCCKAIVPFMMKQKFGRIIGISSRAYLGNRGQANYSSSKGGLVSLTRTLAIELGGYGINVNAVAPGLIDTPLVRGLRPEVLQKLIDSTPTKRMGETIDIANAALFLACDESKFITGEVIHVDGGKSVGIRVS